MTTSPKSLEPDTVLVPAGTLWRSPDGVVALTEVETAIPRASSLLLRFWYLREVVRLRDGRVELDSLTPLLGSAALATKLLGEVKQRWPELSCDIDEVFLAYKLDSPDDLKEFRGVAKAAMLDEKLAELH